MGLQHYNLLLPNDPALYLQRSALWDADAKPLVPPTAAAVDTKHQSAGSGGSGSGSGSGGDSGSSVVVAVKPQVPGPADSKHIGTPHGMYAFALCTSPLI